MQMLKEKIGQIEKFLTQFACSDANIEILFKHLSEISASLFGYVFSDLPNEETGALLPSVEILQKLIEICSNFFAHKEERLIRLLGNNFHTHKMTKCTKKDENIK